MGQTKVTESGMMVCGHGIYFHGEECPYCRGEEKRKSPHEKAVEAELKRIRELLERR